MGVPFMLQRFEFTSQALPHDYHAASAVTYGELEDCGFIDWEAPEWAWDAYDDAQRARLQQKIGARYRWREIGILPWGAWRDQLVRTLNEIMPKFKLLYYKVNSEGFDPFLAGDDHGKERTVYSDFPATLIDPENGDYASSAHDHEFETRREGDTLEKVTAIRDGYADVDVLILDELEPLFSSLITVNANGF